MIFYFYLFIILIFIWNIFINKILTEKYCPYCSKNVEKIKFIKIEELLAGFNQNIDKFDSICPNCLTVVNSNIYYLNMRQKEISIQQFQLLKPNRLIN